VPRAAIRAHERVLVTGADSRRRSRRGWTEFVVSQHCSPFVNRAFPRFRQPLSALELRVITD